MGAIFHELYKKRFGWPPDWRVCILVALGAAIWASVVTARDGFGFNSAVALVAVVTAVVQALRSHSAKVRSQGSRRTRSRAQPQHDDDAD